MNESILKALMQLFALVVNVDDEGLSPEARAIIEDYLKLQLSEDLVAEYLGLFDYYLRLYRTSSKDSRKRKKRIASKSVKVLTIGEDINEQLQQKEKIIVIIRLLEFIMKSETTEEELDFVDTIANVFNINTKDYKNLKYFLLSTLENIESSYLIKAGKGEKAGELKTLNAEMLNGTLYFLYLRSSNLILLKYEGKDIVYLNGFILTEQHCYVFDEGSVIKNPKINPIYYSDIIGKFIHSRHQDKIFLCAENISFTFPKSNNGIKHFTIKEESGKLVGIMGASGAGKSTLLNLLIGTLPLDSGHIYINGYEISRDKSELEGIIGYIPQDDLLIEELTVFQNIYYNAKLCFRGDSTYKIITRVVRILKELDLYEIKDLKVGDALNKYISGGQRKRLNIALELIREPAILFVDEPTSGLSSADSDVVMSLLKELTLKGKLVFINIHQPSSDIFKLFDKIIILDKGGYPVYYGNPIAGITYFRRLSNIANAEAVICPTCGNINPDQILELIEAKIVNEYGKLTNKRKNSPEFWYKKFKENIGTKQSSCNKERRPLPKVHFNLETAFQQFKIFSIRNFLRKITNLQYVLINLLEAPILAIILAFFSKYISGTTEDPNAYIFSENVNLPAFMFMSVVVALFMGMTVSAEDIIKDKKILKREEFLNLSYKAYINSKVFFLVVLSAFQMLLYVVISHQILEIKGLLFRDWFILFTTAVWANILGLNISAMMNSVITIYISIPLILIPQLLFSGTVIEFSKLHRNFSSQKYVPIIGDIMVSRWSYEALMVSQFKDNPYEQNYFEADRGFYNATYYLSTYYDALEKISKYIMTNQNNEEKKEIVRRKLTILRNELDKIAEMTGKNFEYYDSLDNMNQAVKDKLINYLYYNVKVPNMKKQKYYRQLKDKITDSLQKVFGGYEALASFQNTCHNKRVSDYVCNNLFEVKKITESEKELIRLYYPIFQTPESKIGRAHFYAPFKVLGNLEIDTFWFNTIFIWIFSFVLYFLLVFKPLEGKKLLKELAPKNTI